MDISDLPESLVLCIQIKGNKAIVFGKMRISKAKQIFIDKKGIVWPDDLQEIGPNGPTITFTLEADDKVISLDGLSVEVRDNLGMKLRTDILEHEIVRVREVPTPQSLTITVRDAQGKTWSTKLFSKFRAAGYDVVLYSIGDAGIGRALATNPSQD